VTWVSAYQTDPFTISIADKVALLAEWSTTLLRHDAVSHVDASLQQIRECKFYADGATTATQQRVRLSPVVTAVAVTDDGRFDTMRTIAPPAGRGYEYLTGTGWDFDAELAELHELAAAVGHGPDVVAANRRFHRALNLAAGSPRLMIYLRQAVRVVPASYFDLFPEQESRSRADHAALLDAIGRGDGAAARSIAEAHVLDAGTALGDWLRAHSASDGARSAT